MIERVRIGVIAIVVSLVGFAGFSVAPRAAAPAQEKPAPQADKERQLVPLRVTVVISRHQGEKRLSNLPFTLTLNATQRTNLRMGAEVPIPRQTMKEGGLVSSYEYRRIGTMIDCGAGPLQDDGRVALSLTIDDTQVMLEDGSTGSQMKGLPRFHSFTSNATITLRDGQTMQYTAATDKVTGEVVRVEVTLNAAK